jgi:hypothetical protein
VSDSSGGVLGKVTVKIRNVDTNLEQVSTTKDDGSFLVSALPIGRYSVSFARDGFKTEVHDQIVVQALQGCGQVRDVNRTEKERASRQHIHHASGSVFV